MITRQSNQRQTPMAELRLYELNALQVFVFVLFCELVTQFVPPVHAQEQPISENWQLRKPPLLGFFSGVTRDWITKM